MQWVMLAAAENVVQKDKPAATAVFAVIPSHLPAVNAKSKELTLADAQLA